MRVALAASLVMLSLSALAGCANSSYALKNQVESLQQQQVVLQQRNQELQSRASTLDRDNQELETLLAQTRQQSKVVEDQLAAVRDQLATATAQMSQLRDDKQLTDKQTEALLASTRKRIGAKITANNSLGRTLPLVNVPGVEVRQDGDVVRVELPSARLFQGTSAAMQPVAGAWVDTVINELARAYPQQTIGIEGHTDGDVIRGAGVDNQSLSVARATAVYQYIVSRGQIPATRLFIVGHGSNHPVVSNATAAGKGRNNRVELVVYPEATEPAR